MMTIGEFGSQITANPDKFYGRWNFVGPDLGIDNKKNEIQRLQWEFKKLLFKRRAKQKRQRIHAKLKKARFELVALILSK